MARFTKKIIVTLLFIFTTLFAFTQPQNSQRYNQVAGNGLVKGIVIDKTTSTPVGYASVALYNKTDSTPVNGMITDDKGRFSIAGIRPGIYFVKIEFVGYKTFKSKAFQLQKDNPVHNLDTIKIISTAQTLQEVTITSEKNMVQSGLDKKVFNVAQNITSSGGTALELMQNIPAVSVDIDGNVSLRGNSNVTILVDGRPSLLTSLDQMPASMIESIEVITNPSAKYDPDGTAGIINIVLKKDRAQGYNGQFSFTAGTKDKYNASVALNYRKNKFNVFTNYNMRYFSFDGHGTGTTIRDTLLPDTTLRDTTYRLRETEVFHRTGITNNIKVGTDYFINKKNTISLSALYNLSSRRSTERINNNSSDSINVMDDRTTVETDKNNGIDLALEYKKTFDQKGRELTGGVYYTISDGKEYLDTHDQFTLPKDSLSLQQFYNDNKSYNMTLQADYVQPIGEKGKLEAGYRSYIRETYMNFNTKNLDTLSNQYITDLASLDSFTYKQQIHSVYGILTNSINKFEYQLGLRFEESLVTSIQQSSDKSYKQNIHNLFPSAHLEQKINDNNTIMLSYSRRINRPNPNQLNPFIDKSDNRNWRTGNPDLKPEYINSLELGHLLIWGKNNSLNSSIFYKHSKDMIWRLTQLDSLNINHITFDNIGSATNFGFEFIYQQSFARWWNINANASFYKNIISHTTDLGLTKTTNDNSWTLKGTSNFLLSKSLSVQVMGNYLAPRNTPQGIFNGFHSVDLGIKQDILKGKGSFTFRLTDVFNTMAFKIYIVGDNNNYDYNKYRKRDSRVFYLGFTYKINNFKTDRKKKGEEENQNNNNGEMME